MALSSHERTHNHTRTHINEPRSKKTGLRGFRPGLTQTGMYSHRRWLEAWNFGFRKFRDCTIRVAKTKALISFAVTAKLICVIVFAYAKSRFSHNEAQIFMIKMVFLNTERRTMGVTHVVLLTLLNDRATLFQYHYSVVEPR